MTNKQMTDRELLEMAAKASGIEIQGWDGERAYISDPYTRLWNPLTNDGDALRLAVKLELDIEFDVKPDGPQTYVTAVGRDLDCRTSYERHNKDPYAATRRAIVRAAAEIGKGIAQEPVSDDLQEDNYYKTQAEAEEIGKTTTNNKGWQPIETAPRYKRILVTGTDIGTCVASAGWDTETPDEIRWGVVNDICVEPTHWQHLPAPLRKEN